MISKLFKRARWIAGICRQKGMLAGLKKVQNELYSSDFWHLFYISDYGGSAINIDDPAVSVDRVSKGDVTTLKAIAEQWPRDFGVWKQAALYKMLVDRSANMPCYTIKHVDVVVGAVWFDNHDNVVESLGEKLKANQVVVRNIFIVSQFRGKGYSKMLLSHAMADIYRQGVNQFYAVAYPYKVGTEKMCLSLGYKFTHKLKEKRRLFNNTVTAL